MAEMTHPRHRQEQAPAHDLKQTTAAALSPENARIFASLGQQADKMAKQFGEMINNVKTIATNPKLMA